MGSAAAPAAVRSVALLAGLGAAVALRLWAGGPDAAASVPAGLLFAVALLALAVTVGIEVRVDRVSLLAGAAGVAVLVTPVLIGLLVAGPDHPRPRGSFPLWALATLVVATSEEALLRGALFSLLERWRGEWAATLVGAVAFAGLHLPLYGWGSVPLDLSVGLLLGALRVLSGGWLAPAVAHVAADLVGWWLV